MQLNVYVAVFLIGFWHLVEHTLFFPLSSVTEEVVVGPVTNLHHESRGEVVRISWVGVQGATAYRVVWMRSEGEFVAGAVTWKYGIRQTNPRNKWGKKIASYDIVKELSEQRMLNFLPCCEHFRGLRPNIHAWDILEIFCVVRSSWFAAQGQHKRLHFDWTVPFLHFLLSDPSPVRTVTPGSRPECDLPLHNWRVRPA